MLIANCWISLSIYDNCGTNMTEHWKFQFFSVGIVLIVVFYKKQQTLVSSLPRVTY